jgi:hypothetical protein
MENAFLCTYIVLTGHAVCSYLFADNQWKIVEVPEKYCFYLTSELYVQLWV